MTQEEKAQRYNEALKFAKIYYKQGDEDMKTMMETCFPELKESEEERIRKDMIETIKKESKNFPSSVIAEKSHTWLAWLEKQGEKEINDNDIAVLENWENAVKENKEKWQLSDWFVEATSLLVRKVEYMGQGIKNDSNKTMLNACINALRNVGHQHLANWLEKQGEQKSADKVEPKFKVGDWIITNKSHIWYVDETPETTSYLYRLINQYGKVEVAEFEVVDKKARLWTIQDAKAGDVLVDEDNNIGIHKDIEGIYWNSYIYLGCDGKLRGFSIGGGHKQANTRLATKEQCDFFFKKLKEAGYEWDAEKKELKKIEQKPAAWSEDERMYRGLHNLIYSTSYCDSRKEFSDFLNSLKDRVQPQPQQQWGEEDEKMYNVVHNLTWESYKTSRRLDIPTFGIINDWLKSLKDRYTWKQSEEQIKTCKEVYADILSAKGFDLGTVNNELNKLEEELKKLKE